MNKDDNNISFTCKNLEIKLSVNDFGIIPTTFTNHYVDKLNQCDIFFKGDKGEGRLKLRTEYSNKEGKSTKPHFIRYSREDLESEKVSNYNKYYIDDLEAFKNTFNGFLKEEVVVDKERELYLYENARIHLDTVQSLPLDKCHFVEIEVVITNETENENAKGLLEKLLSLMDLKSSSSSTSSTWTPGVKVVKESYRELVLDLNVGK